VTQRTPRNLAGSLKHVRYEIGMFHQTAAELIAGRFGEGVVRNALLESFTVHARILLQFFFPASPGDDEVLAAHFFGDTTEWRKLRGAVPASLEKVRSRVGKEIAHLTFDRVEIGPEAKLWHIADMLLEMNGVVAKFFEHLPSQFHPPLGVERPSGASEHTVQWSFPQLSGTSMTAVNSTTVNTVVASIPKFGDDEKP
jgi:hypothetical protein